MALLLLTTPPLLIPPLLTPALQRLFLTATPHGLPQHLATTADPSVISNSASPAVYTINSTSTVGGAFLISDNTKSGTAGVLFSASDFAAPGDRAVSNGDTINITYTFSLDAA